jgi:hypothetical protein
VVFYPTHQAAQFLTQLKEEMRYNADWQRAKERILKRLQNAQDSNPADALREALSNLPDTKASLNYCAEMISVLLLNIERMRDKNITPVLENLANRGQLGLAALAGLSLGTSLTETSDDSTLREKLVAHTQRFQNQLADLSDESVNKLSAFFNDAMLTLRQT